MQVPERVVLRNLYPSPDWRSDVFQRDFELIHLLEFVSVILTITLVPVVFVPVIIIHEILAILLVKSVLPAKLSSRERIHDGSGRGYDIEHFQR